MVRSSRPVIGNSFILRANCIEEADYKEKKKRSGWRPTAGNSLDDCYHQVDIRSSSGGHPTASGIGATRAGKPPGDGDFSFLRSHQQHPVRRNPVGQCRQQSCNVTGQLAVHASVMAQPVAHNSLGRIRMEGACFVSPIRDGFSWFVNCSMLNQGELRRGVEVNRPEEGASRRVLDPSKCSHRLLVETVADHIIIIIVIMAADENAGSHLDTRR